VVWAFTVRDDDEIEGMKRSPLAQRVTRVYIPKSVATRITAQRACFTIHGYNKAEGRFTPLEEDPRYKRRLRKLLIKWRPFHKIRFQLDRCGINNASLFPDIGGLCQHVEWVHLPLRDE
jgi:hypothetical protein